MAAVGTFASESDLNIWLLQSGREPNEIVKIQYPPERFEKARKLSVALVLFGLALMIASPILFFKIE